VPVLKKRKTRMLTKNQIEELYNKYLEIIKWEVEELKCNKTELTHLIGRLGEFYCAKFVNGSLAHATNQHGFDVIKENEKTISVKATAQKNSFVSINGRTHEKADELMVLQLKNNFEIEIIYYGSMKLAINNSRPWKERHEFDISNAKRIYSSLIKIRDIDLQQENEAISNGNTNDFYFSVVNKKHYLKIKSKQIETNSVYYIFEVDNWNKADNNQFIRDTIEITASWTQIDTSTPS
jgi:hypothetical protein